MSIMRRRLEMPNQFAGIDIDGDDRASVEVISLTTLPSQDRIGVTRSEVIEMQFGILGAGNPGHAAAMTHGVFVRP